jgi:hypothetical protein
MPMEMARICDAMLPRLQAEESFLAIVRTGIGTGAVKDEHAKAIMRDWQQEIDRLSPDPAPRVYPTAEYFEQHGLRVFGKDAPA